MRCFVQLACGCLTVSGMASAGTAVPDARALGLAEAMLGYCAKVVPQAAARQREQVRLLVGTANRETLNNVRHSREYRQAYDSESGFIAKVESHNVHRLCSEPLPGSR